jgi:hypothetical protein
MKELSCSNAAASAISRAVSGIDSVLRRHPISGPSLAARSSQDFFVLSNFALSNTDHQKSSATGTGKAVP